MSCVSRPVMLSPGLKVTSAPLAKDDGRSICVRVSNTGTKPRVLQRSMCVMQLESCPAQLTPEEKQQRGVADSGGLALGDRNNSTEKVERGRKGKVCDEVLVQSCSSVEASS